jgi:hypothetical protein
MATASCCVQYPPVLIFTWACILASVLIAVIGRVHLSTGPRVALAMCLIIPSFHFLDCPSMALAGDETPFV